jgi:hypothetical protein
MGIMLASTGLPLLTSTGLAAARAAPSGSGGVVPLPPEKPVLRSGTEFTHRGTTWTFYAGSSGSTKQPVSWHVSANGDPVVITDQAYMPGPVYLEIDPPSRQDASGIWMHGAMIDPYDPEQSNATNRLGQGFEEGISLDVEGAQGTQKYHYEHARNDDPGATGARLRIDQGDAFCLVKAIRDPGKIPFNASDSGHYLLISKYVAVGFMDTAPPGPGTWFRPGISAPTKAWPARRLEDIDLATEASQFRHLPRPSGLDMPSAALSLLRGTEEITVPFWSVTGERGRRSYPSLAGSTYAPSVGERRGEMAASLHIDTRANPAEQAARVDLARYLVQWGIDLDGAHQAGQTHSNGAGQHYGYLPFIYIAAFAMQNPAMLARAQAHKGNSIGQIFWVTEDMIGFPVNDDIGSSGGGSRRACETFQIEHLGKPDWYTDPGWQDADIDRLDAPAGEWNDMNASWWAAYRSLNWDVHPAELMPIALLRNGPGGIAGDVAVRRGGAANDPSHLGGSSLAYLDRAITVRPWRESGVSSHGGTPRAIYDGWRDVIAGTSPRWTGTPDITASHASQLRVFWTGDRSGEIYWECTGHRANYDAWNYSTLPVTRREIAYSQDGVQWSDPIDLGTSQVYVVENLRPQTLHWLRWRQWNSAGAGLWSPTWAQNRENGTASKRWKSPRGRYRTGGTLGGGAVTNLVAPKICYRPYPEYGWMPFYEPVSDLATDPVYGPDSAAIETLYAGIGYWTGGSASNWTDVNNADDPAASDWNGDLLAASYQWQRDAGGGFANISGATSQSYGLTGSDAGARIRCVVTVRGASADSNAVSVPA